MCGICSPRDLQAAERPIDDQAPAGPRYLGAALLGGDARAGPGDWAFPVLAGGAIGVAPDRRLHQHRHFPLAASGAAQRGSGGQHSSVFGKSSKLTLGFSIPPHP
jgi:hypothetical protein